MALCGSQGLVFRTIADSSAVTGEDGAISSYTTLTGGARNHARDLRVFVVVNGIWRRLHIESVLEANLATCADCRISPLTCEFDAPAIRPFLDVSWSLAGRIAGRTGNRSRFTIGRAW